VNTSAAHRALVRKLEYFSPTSASASTSRPTSVAVSTSSDVLRISGVFGSTMSMRVGDHPVLHRPTQRPRADRRSTACCG
jgi:hypothetical protein